MRDRIAAVGRFAIASEAGPQCVAGHGSEEQRARSLVEDGVVDVYPLDVLGRADRPVRVRGRVIHAEAIRTLADTVEN